MKCSNACAIGMVLLLSGLAGCGGASPSSAAKSTGPLTIDPAELPKLGDYLAPVDDGRIQVAPPAGWAIPPRSNRFVARFQPNLDAEYPIVLITAKDCEEIFNVSSENLGKLASLVRREESVQQTRPIRIGKFQGVTYRKRGREKESINRIVERLIIDTVVAGRRYSVELRSRPESLRDNQPYLFAVANGIKFLKLEGAPPATAGAPLQPAGAVAEAEPKPAAPSEPATEAPAEAKPSAKPASKPQVEPQPKAPSKPEVQPKPKPEAKPQPKAAPEPKKPAAKKGKDDGLEGLDDLLR